MLTKEFIHHCLKKAEQKSSGLSEQVLSIGGLTTHKIKHLLNNVCSLKNTSYLEIGACNAAMLLAASYKNSGSFTGIDNYSQSKEVLGYECCKQKAKQNISKVNNSSDVKLIAGDCWSQNTLDQIPNSTINVYVYDGDHEYDSQYDALIKYHDKMCDRFCLIVDDWNWDPGYPREATLDAIMDLKLKIIGEWNPFTPGNMYDWWNGLGIFLLDKY